MSILIDKLIEATQLNAEVTGQPVDTTLSKNLDLWAHGVCRLVVMGEIKRGKSSFINALLGVKDLVPVNSNVATSTIFKVSYGEQVAYKVFFKPEAHKEPMVINTADLTRFGTEDGNPGNKEQVEFIQVQCPAPLLKSGVVVVDTPGLGGLFRGHRAITYSYVPKADAVFFVTDSVDTPISELDLEYLRDLREVTQNIFFVQTKSCSRSSQECQERVEHNLDILSNGLKCKREELKYFPVDSSIYFDGVAHKDNEDIQVSGMPKLLEFVQKELQPNKERMLEARALAAAFPTYHNLIRAVESRKSILDADTAEKRKKLQDANRAAKEELEDWRTNKQPTLMLDLNKGLQDIQADAMDMCGALRVGGEVQAGFDKMLQNAGDMEQLRSILEKIDSGLPEYGGKVLQKVQNLVRTKVSDLLAKLAGNHNACTSLAVPDSNVNAAVAKMSTCAISRLNESIESPDTFTSARTVYYGGAALSGIGALAGTILGSIIPGIGNVVGGIIGGAIGGLFGGAKALEIQHKTELKSAKQQAYNAVGQALNSAYTSLCESVKRMFIDINTQATKAIRDFVRTKTAELQQQSAAVNDRAKLEGQELVKQQGQFAQLQLKVSGIKKVVDDWTKANA